MVDLCRPVQVLPPGADTWQRRRWAIKKMDELDALAVTVERLQLEIV